MVQRIKEHELAAWVRPSYAWKSIALARSVLQLGIDEVAYWDGQKVCINKDPWLPFTNIKSFSSVSVLINENTHTWNVEAVHALFSDWEAAAICSIPLPPRPRADRLFWTETTSGLFTVNSLYYLQIQQRAQCLLGEGSWRGKDAKFWKFLWSLSLPPKVKNFIWRACLGILPTNELLWHRHMRKDGFCSVCGCEMESVVHALWSCSAANDVWLQSGLSVQKWGRLIHSFFDLMELLQTRLSLDDALFFCCQAYFIWEQRNKVVFESWVHNPIMVVLVGYYYYPTLEIVGVNNGFKRQWAILIS